jgi:hypothetical protein
MILKIARFLTIMFVSLSMAPAMAHLLEMPPKMGYDYAFWLKISQTLYGPRFGTVGAFFEVGAVITSIILVFMVRHHKPAFAWSILGAICMVAVHASFWIWIAPVNEKIAAMTPETLPTDWTALRYQWECTHAARAYLHIVAMGALIISVLVETDNRISTIGKV